MQLQLHRFSARPEWDGAANPNWWQRVAIKTSGVLTPGNVITAFGLVLSVWGLLDIIGKDVVLGIVMVSLGRFFDILDGTVAQVTHTKSPLGAFLDAATDKILILFAFITLVIGHVMPWPAAAIILVANIVNFLLSLVINHRGLTPHPSKAGKLSMMYSWLAFGGFIFNHAVQPHHAAARVCLSIGYAFLGIFFLYEILAVKDFWVQAFSKKVTRPKL